MVAWIDRLLLSVPRPVVDGAAMAITAAALLLVAAVVVALALALGRRTGGTEGPSA